MANRKVNSNYKSCIVHKNDDGEFIFEEVKKDGSQFFNITQLLDSLVGCQEVSLGIAVGEEIQPDADEI